jgi:predicted nucleic acid-binding Zn ribbon protein
MSDEPINSKEGLETGGAKEGRILPCQKCGKPAGVWAETCSSCGEILLPHTSRARRIVYLGISILLLVGAAALWFAPGSPISESGFKLWFAIIELVLLAVGIPLLIHNARRISGDPIDERLRRRTFKLAESGDTKDLEQASSVYPERMIHFYIRMDQQEQVELVAERMKRDGTGSWNYYGLSSCLLP